jgi:hypothetical protein
VRGHVDPETLAAFREDLLPPRRARRVTAHLAVCTRCAGLDAQLAGLPALLAQAPAPPMPDALTTRIEAALAAEAAARPAQAPAGVPGAQAAAGASAPAPGPRDGGAARRGGRRAAGPGRSRLALRIAVAAAAVVLIAGGGYGVSRLVSGGVTGSPSTAPPAHLPAEAPAQNGPAASPQEEGPDHRSAAGGSSARYPVVTSGTDYRASDLKAQVRATLMRFPAAVAAPSAGTASGASVFGPASSCMAGVAEGQRPRLVDVARYEGKPATVVVVPYGARTLRALVFGGHCPAAAAGPLASTVVPSPG